MLNVVCDVIVFKVKGVLMDSKLPLDTLGKIWDLADQDKDGMLDRHEFIAVSCLSGLYLLRDSFYLHHIYAYGLLYITY